MDGSLSFPLLQEVATESEILSEENPPIGGIISELASHPLVSEKDPEVRKEAMPHIIKIAACSATISCR